ncbi:MAG: JmjC domain-containing protein [Pseudomonadota bacterium]
MTWLGKDSLRRFGALTPQQFLRDYWQQRPLFVRNAVPEIAGLMDGGDLAGLALDEHAESRIVLQHADGSWELRRGPFKEKTFKTLPKENWTLLVQAVDHFLPDAAELLDRFNFLPHWRIDDLMVSYAVAGGGVGPHYDSYDVFLIQGIGTRLWRIGSAAGEQDLLPHPDLRILKKMAVTQEFLCEPGDLLYLPPHLAHWGIAQGECMTYSVGFRTPSDRELLDGFCNHLVEQTPERQRYGDSGSKPVQHPGVLEPQAIAALRTRLTHLIKMPGALEAFLGRALSEPKYATHATATPAKRWTKAALGKALMKAGAVRRDEGSRFLLVPDASLPAPAPALYVDGERFVPEHASTKLLVAAALIANHRVIDPPVLRELLADEAAATLILHLFNSGHLYLPDSGSPEKS